MMQLQLRPLTGHLRAFSHKFNIRALSTASSLVERPLRILYATQTGTAKQFATELQQELSNYVENISVKALNEDPPATLLQDNNAVYLFLTSTSGVGEVPNNGRTFFQYIAENKDQIQPIDYCIFGLGNKAAHPNHFNAAAKLLEESLQKQKCNPILPLALGDDGDCIEDDFDQFQSKLVQRLQGKQVEPETVAPQRSEKSKSADEDGQAYYVKPSPPKKGGSGGPVYSSECGFIPSSTSKKGGQRKASIMGYPELKLTPAESTIVRQELPMTYYDDHVYSNQVAYNINMNTEAVANGLHELCLSLPQGHAPYEAGDHFVVYPRNADCVVEAYLQLLDVDPHTKIEAVPSNYPHPTGLTVYETLSHFVDLGSPPSPSFSRFLTGLGQELNYKQDIVHPQRTVLDLFYEYHPQETLNLEDLLNNLTPMKPRYYSIASSPRKHPDEILLTYRPVRYLTNRGSMRQGISTSYMASLKEGSHVMGYVSSNPKFRLPEDPMTPICLIAGGCGIAPIRAFLEDRLSDDRRCSPAIVFLGFRNPADQAYKDILEEATKRGVVDQSFVTFVMGVPESRFVTHSMRAQSQQILEHFERGGYTYLCGGARTFGVAVEQEVLTMLQERMSLEDATAYLQKMIHEGRFCEDLAD